jgi:DNA-binding MarR family transcriptional regulator
LAVVGRARARQDTPKDNPEEIVEHLFALVDRLRGEFEAAVGSFDLSAQQAKALRYLAHAGPVPMHDLAGTMQCDKSNVTGLVDRLERRGLVERRAAPDDRRVTRLVITDEGTVLAHRLWAHVVEESGAVVGLTRDERIALLTLLRRLDQEPQRGCWIRRV